MTLDQRVQQTAFGAGMNGTICEQSLRSALWVLQGSSASFWSAFEFGAFAFLMEARNVRRESGKEAAG